MKKRFKVTIVLMMTMALLAGIIASLRMENIFAEENGSSEGVTVVIREEYDKKAGSTIIILTIQYLRIMTKIPLRLTL